MEADIEDEDVEIVGCVPLLTDRGIESEGLTFSEIVWRKRQEGQTVSKGIVDTYVLPNSTISTNFNRILQIWPF